MPNSWEIPLLTFKEQTATLWRGSLGTGCQAAFRNPSLSIASDWILPTTRMSLEEKPKLHMMTEAMTNTLISAL